MEFLYVLERLRNPFLDGLMQALTWLGQETLALPLLLLMYWCINKRVGLELLFCTFFGAGTNAFLKLCMQVPRPWLRNANFTIVESARKAATGFSFPSGHTQTAVGLYGVLSLWVKNKAAKLALLLLILLIGFSRLYLGVHTLNDVLLSLLVGTVIVLIGHILFSRSEQSIRMGFLVLFLLNLAFLIIMQYIPLLNPADADIAAHLHKNAALAVGGSLALFLASCIHGAHIRFNPRTNLLAQGIKLGLGLALIIGLRMGLKPLLHGLLADEVLADILRYFLITLFALVVWPMSFAAIERATDRLLRRG